MVSRNGIRNIPVEDSVNEVNCVVEDNISSSVSMGASSHSKLRDVAYGATGTYDEITSKA